MSPSGSERISSRAVSCRAIQRPARFSASGRGGQEACERIVEPASAVGHLADHVLADAPDANVLQPAAVAPGVAQHLAGGDQQVARAALGQRGCGELVGEAIVQLA